MCALSKIRLPQLPFPARLWSALLLTGMFLTHSRLSSADQPVFEAEARRVLKTWCWHCHGEEAEFKGGLDARFVRQLQKGGDSGPAIVPHDPAASLLIQRITSGEMPPGDKKVPAQDLQVLQQWIAAGAKVRSAEPEQAAPGLLLTEEDRSHWAFQPIVRPPVPFAGQPNAPANPIDAFLLQRLQQHGLQFAAEADRETLLRRLWLDVAGLPPVTAAIDQFTA
ncbi:MAG: c-type cytochrome domain-containing protein, partial [Planctomycetaceae bacterium]